jgi:microcin C transport system substrate-binding protein
VVAAARKSCHAIAVVDPHRFGSVRRCRPLVRSPFEELTPVTRPLLALLVSMILSASAALPARAAEPTITKSWALAEFGTPLYGPDMPHFPYVNPRAPKGGSVTLGAQGSFDTLNTIVEKGEWPLLIGLTSDALMVGSGDEISVLYGLIAETVEYPADYAWAIFNLRPEAKFHDGVAITAEDFVFAFDTIEAHGRVFLKAFYRDIEKFEALSPHRLKVTFKTRNTKKPLMIAAATSPLPRHYWANRDITQSTLEPPIDSGAYRIAAVDPGRSITYERVKDYWGAELNVAKGTGNFDRIKLDYYLDETVLFEAFKAGQIDYRTENRAQRWAEGYNDIAAVKTGSMLRLSFPDPTPQGAQGLFFNLRREPFKDIRVREAIVTLFDFQAIQRTLLAGQYERTQNWFVNSDFSHRGKPEGRELALLEPFRAALPPAVFERAFAAPQTDGSGRDRNAIRRANELFRAAGYEVRDGRLVKADTGAPLALEILLVSDSQVRLTEPFINALRRAGVDARLRVVDTSQFQNRLNEFDFDLVSLRSNFFPPPGPELRSYYGSAAADQPASANWSGIKDPVVDALIETVIAARSYDELVAAARALDRVLSFGWYLVPQWFNDETWVATWNRFGFPERMPKYGAPGMPGLAWYDAEKAATVRK